MKIHIARVVAAFWLLVLSLTSLTLAQAPASSNVTTTGGTVNAIPLFTTATNIQSSILTQTGTTGLNVLGKLTLPAAGVATASGGKNSLSEGFVASAFNSTTSTAVAQTFQLQAEPAGNNTAAASGTLNLLYGSGTNAATETGLKISNKGVITFALGQTFPGGAPSASRRPAASAMGARLSSRQALPCQRRTSAHRGRASRRPVPRSF